MNNNFTFNPEDIEISKERILPGPITLSGCYSGNTQAYRPGGLDSNLALGKNFSL